MQTDTTIDEIRFLAAMTALEAIIESQLPARRGTSIPKQSFSALREALAQVISADENLNENGREIFLAKISGLNKKTFSEKIDALFDHYGISRRDFTGTMIVDLIKYRNEIVHRGTAPTSVDLWSSIVLVRELITRIVLNEIGFAGRYCCYVGGLHDRSFPDRSATERSDSKP